MLAGIAAGGFDEIGRVAEATRPDVADVGREAAAELAAQAQAEAGIAQALADVVLVVVAAVEVGLKLRLQDQPVGQQYLVFAFEPGGQASGGADVASGLDLELVGHQSLHADRGRSEEHTSELQSLMRISYAVFCLKKKTKTQ